MQRVRTTETNKQRTLFEGENAQLYSSKWNSLHAEKWASGGKQFRLQEHVKELAGHLKEHRQGHCRG